jgi:hypothetical protein
MVRAALHVGDAVALELLLERSRPPPGRVLPALVGQDLARGAIVGDPPRERLHHERALLVMRHHEAHEIARVVVYEGRHVHALLAAQEEREEIRLPQLVGLRALEPAWRGLRPAPALRARRLRLDAFLLEHPPYRRFRGPDPEEALHHIADATAARKGLRRLRREHRLAPRVGLARTDPARARPPRTRLEHLRTALPVLAAPLGERRIGNVQPPRHLADADSLIDDHRRRGLHQVQRPRLARRLASCCLPFRVHFVRSFRAPMCSPIEGEVLGIYAPVQPRIRWFAAHAILVRRYIRFPP